jgi:2',3'-cyclic-nucleotide 2'-phosphodiesterase (5'-nucleotidase family)
LKEPDLNKRHAPLFSVALSLALFGGAILARQIYSAPEKQAPAGSVSITLLDTTDTHGRIEPWDYYAGKPANIGLAKIATLIKQQRAESPEALLLDCGDTIQGTPLAYYFASKDTSKPNPMIAAFNLLHYDAMAVGNHEFNFGEEAMWKAKQESQFPWLAANIKETYTKGVPYFQPYIIKNVKGVRVGIVGFVTPGIPRWEIPDHYKGYQFEPIVAAAKRVIPDVRRQVDLVVVIMHSGFYTDPVSGETWPEQLPGENVAPDLAEVPGIDVIFYGHTHSELPEKFINGVLMAQPKNWGMSLARADLQMNRGADGRWQVASKHSRTIPVSAQVEADPEMMKLAEQYHQETEKYLDTPVAQSPKDFSGKYARYEDTPLLDAIQNAQLEAGHADVSMATMLYAGVHIPAGPVTVRQAAALYIYENTLYVVQMDGEGLKAALEHAASFFSQWPVSPADTIKLPSYNADQAAGVSYEIDLTKPVGQRILNLTFHGKPLEDRQKLRVAINNYRYTGGGGYSVYKGLPVVFRSSNEIREILIDYLSRSKTLPDQATGNWKMEPPEAVAAIEHAADANVGAQSK